MLCEKISVQLIKMFLHSLIHVLKPNHMYV